MPLPLRPPLAPMLARLARELPEGDLLYEPKWDGFRCLAFVEGGAVELQSRHARPLARYFPEIVEALAGHPWERGFNLGASPVGRLAGSAGRWDPAGMSLDWTAVAPERVVEVAYDRLDGLRFRHPARLRPDREARSCALDQLAAELEPAPAPPR